MVKKEKMREILFRGKRVNNGEWVEGYFCRKYFPKLPHDRCVIQYKTECTKEWKPDYMVAEVIPETIGQYTGLTDKNGTKIFEGDILMAHFVSNRSKQHFKVIFESGAFVFDNGSVKVPVWDIYCLKVIGNIHDNPKALNEV